MLVVCTAPPNIDVVFGNSAADTLVADCTKLKLVLDALVVLLFSVFCANNEVAAWGVVTFTANNEPVVVWLLPNILAVDAAGVEIAWAKIELTVDGVGVDVLTVLVTCWPKIEDDAGVDTLAPLNSDDVPALVNAPELVVAILGVDKGCLNSDGALAVVVQTFPNNAVVSSVVVETVSTLLTTGVTGD